MKIYTKQGDKGQTQLIGKRVSKTDPRVEAYGTVDELNSFIGSACAELEKTSMKKLLHELHEIQHELFDLGGDMADVSGKNKWKLTEKSVQRLEEQIDHHWDQAPEIRTFILPGGEPGAAQLHVCRTVARRAERLTAAASTEEPFPPQALPYLNRLSDYFFAAARAVNSDAGREDVLYARGSQVFSTDKE
ncbi:cob(I)yrinic acid a,c-diamide adenosyltransferase [Alkalicoccus urumqiensis]|uniref:Corrinoid adenosyltransferase n=1 Tax=Alkalicoccus urumqiensis TaxID=1548213 RepID=A0A2P6MKG3_ALKUR|nr:cob(I)yrinic acid a,c-diamide adenosyltransferase [Alkalicoccus urumqiensis]PRO66779.1 ATP:cob(I)alamin adenosyltransferase [Alkalicoccus urumqiensis]